MRRQMVVVCGINGTGKTILKTIKKAKAKGFYVVMNYIGVGSPEIAKVEHKILRLLIQI